MTISFDSNGSSNSNDFDDFNDLAPISFISEKSHLCDYYELPSSEILTLFFKGLTGSSESESKYLVKSVSFCLSFSFLLKS